MYNGERSWSACPPTACRSGATHPYSKLLFASVPKLDPGWLDSLGTDPELHRVPASGSLTGLRAERCSSAADAP